MDELKMLADWMREHMPKDGQWVTMTQATEIMWGTSGRGSRKAVLRIEALGRMDVLEIRDAGKRNRVVRLKEAAH